MKKIPDFFIAGAPRCGTTTLYHAIQAYPDVYMSPVKEPHYFAMADIRKDLFRSRIKKDLSETEFNNWLHNAERPYMHRWYVEDWSLYTRLFERAESGALTGEASTSYLWAPNAATRIHERSPNAKFVVCLRHPAERAYSHYLMERRMGLTRKPFHEHLAEDLRTTQRWWGATPLYVDLGLYFRQVKRLIETFGSEQIFFCLIDDLKDRMQETLEQIANFLGMPGTAVPLSGERRNTALRHRNMLTEQIVVRPGIRRLAHKVFKNRVPSIKKWFYTTDVEKAMPRADRRFLLRTFRDDTEQLQGLIGRDLSCWLK